MPQTKSSRYAARKKNPAATSLGMRTGKTRETYILPWQKHKFGMLALGAVAVLVFVGLVAGGTRAQTTLPAAGQRGGLGYGDLATIVSNMQTTINNLTTTVNNLSTQVTNLVNSGGGGGGGITVRTYTNNVLGKYMGTRTGVPSSACQDWMYLDSNGVLQGLDAAACQQFPEGGMVWNNSSCSGEPITTTNVKTIWTDCGGPQCYSSTSGELPNGYRLANTPRNRIYQITGYYGGGCGPLEQRGPSWPNPAPCYGYAQDGNGVCGEVRVTFTPSYWSGGNSTNYLPSIGGSSLNTCQAGPCKLQ